MRILIVEDDESTVSFISAGLASSGYDIEHAGDGRDAVARLEDEHYDIVILDRMLPGMDGLSVLKHVRDKPDGTPILMLTALGQIGDRVEGLEAGADDYLVKPFAMSELAARLTAILRRRAADPNVTTLTCGRLMMDVLHREVRYAGKSVALQPREARLLEQMMRNPDKVVTRAMLLESVWGFHFTPQTNLVETHMSRLRTKLAHGGATDLIETVRGAGYRLRTEEVV